MRKEIRDPELSLHITVWEMIQRLEPTNAKIIHVPNGMLRDKRTATLLKLMGVVPGVADFLVFLPGARISCLELKTPEGRQSKDQRDFQKFCESFDIEYRIARTVEESIEMLNHFGIDFKNEVSFADGNVCMTVRP